MYKKLSHIISYVFHPLLMATLLVVLLFFFAPSVLQPVGRESIFPVLVMIFLLTFVIPVLSVSMLKITKSITSLKLESRRERIMPFFFISVYYGLTTYLFANKLVLSDVMVVIFASITIVIFFVAVITLFYKISAHAAGVWGVVGYLMALHLKYPDSHLFWPLILSILIAGAINSSRLFLNTHSSVEVNLGAALGFFVSFGSIFLFT